jgi:hypothetical protein
MHRRLGSGDLSAIAEKLFNGVTIKDRRQGFKVYKQSFVGSEAVEFMLDEGLAPHDVSACELGHQLLAVSTKVALPILTHSVFFFSFALDICGQQFFRAQSCHKYDNLLSLFFLDSNFSYCLLICLRIMCLLGKFLPRGPTPDKKAT